MLADDSLSEVWAKAQKEEALSPKEKVQIHAVLSELTYASVAAYVNPRSAASEQGSVKEIPPALVAAALGTPVGVITALPAPRASPCWGNIRAPRREALERISKDTARPGSTARSRAR